MSMFPTQLAMNIAKKAKLDSLTTHGVDLSAAMADFQKVSVGCELEDALVIVGAHFTRGEPNEEQLDALEKIYNFTSIEVDGIIVDRVGQIMKNSTMESIGLSAAQVLKSIKDGEDVATKGAVKKVIFELEKSSE